MSLQKYKTVDILVFVVLAVVFELLNYTLTTTIEDFRLIFLSYSTVLALICVYRWGLIGSVVSFAGGIAACIISSTKSYELYIAYGIGNLLGTLLSALIFQYGFKRKALENKILLITYFVFAFALTIILRCFIASLFEIESFIETFISSLKNQIVVQSMSLAISLVILLIASRKKGDMLVEMKSYIKNVQDYKKLGGLKEIKESPNFNFDKPLTEPNEMDEAFILDGGQLNNKELQELDAMMYQEIDEQADPMDILTSDSNQE